MAKNKKRSSILEAVLAQRGLKGEGEVEAFLNPDYQAQTHDPFLMPDMPAAVERIATAQSQDEPVAIFGDYDIDGLSATALLLDGLKQLGLEAFAYIPDRFSEGYGVSRAGLESLMEKGAKLAITVDCGSTAQEEIAWAKRQELDVIVTDHHTVGEELPPAAAVINPKRPDSEYPFQDLAGAGVAFKLIQALQKELDGMPSGQEKWLLDLVAMGTVCDVVKLLDENRVFTYFGLQVLAKTRRPGLRALARVSEVDLGAVQAHHLGFRLGPRLNAAGRMEHARQSLNLLTETEGSVALEQAKALDKINSRRQTAQRRIFQEAEMKAQQYAQDPVLVLAGEGWSHGVAGIVAANLVDKHGKPAVVLEKMDGVAKGSARSLGEYNITAGLTECAHLLEKYGGHQAAAGCQLPLANIEKLRQALNDHYHSLEIGDQSHVLEPNEAVVVNDFTQLTWKLYEELERLRPFGMGNPRPVLATETAKINEVRAVGSDKKHLKMVVEDQLSGTSFEAIGFGLADQHPGLEPGRLSAVWFTFDKNEFRGETSLQLKIRKLKPYPKEATQAVWQPA